jgi:UDPglucose 6-dehydrogenase
VGTNVTVIGSGYVGTVLAACFAELGNRVVAVEVDKLKLRSLKQGQAPFYEPGLNDLIASGLNSGRLRFTDSIHFALKRSDIVFLCVGTPPDANGLPDTRFLATAARQIGEALQRHQVLVTKSTVPIGSGKWLAAIVEESLKERLRGTEAFSLVANPEFLREGTAISDFMHPDRIVIGSDDPKAAEMVTELHGPILDQSFDGGDPHSRPVLIRTTLTTAETVKYAANAFLATRLSFINEIARICESMGADVVEVSNAMGLDPRIGSQYLQAGAGYGGSCLGKDIDALAATARECGYRPELLEAVIAVNRRQRDQIVHKLEHNLETLEGKRIGLLGLAFKPGTNDLRDAPALDVAKQIIDRGGTVIAHDPIVDQVPEIPQLRLAASPYEAAEDVDAVVLMTEWDEFLEIDLVRVQGKMKGNLFIDGRNFFDPSTAAAAGLLYEGVGRSPKTPTKSQKALSLAS